MKKTKAVTCSLQNWCNKHLKIYCIRCLGYKDKKFTDLARLELRVQMKTQKRKLIIKYITWPQTPFGMRAIINIYRKADTESSNHLGNIRKASKRLQSCRFVEIR